MKFHRLPVIASILLLTHLLSAATFSLPSAVYTSSVQYYLTVGNNSVGDTHVIEGSTFRNGASLIFTGEVAGSTIIVRSNTFLWIGGGDALQVLIPFSSGSQLLVQGNTFVNSSLLWCTFSVGFQPTMTNSFFNFTNNNFALTQPTSDAHYHIALFCRNVVNTSVVVASNNFSCTWHVPMRIRTVMTNSQLSVSNNTLYVVNSYQLGIHLDEPVFRSTTVSIDGNQIFMTTTTKNLFGIRATTPVFGNASSLSVSNNLLVMSGVEIIQAISFVVPEIENATTLTFNNNIAILNGSTEIRGLTMANGFIRSVDRFEISGNKFTISGTMLPVGTGVIFHVYLYWIKISSVEVFVFNHNILNGSNYGQIYPLRFENSPLLGIRDAEFANNQIFAWSHPQAGYGDAMGFSSSGAVGLATTPLLSTYRIHHNFIRFAGGYAINGIMFGPLTFANLKQFSIDSNDIHVHGMRNQVRCLSIGGNFENSTAVDFHHNEFLVTGELYLHQTVVLSLGVMNVSRFTFTNNNVWAVVSGWDSEQTYVFNLVYSTFTNVGLFEMTRNQIHGRSDANQIFSLVIQYTNYLNVENILVSSNNISATGMNNTFYVVWFSYSKIINASLFQMDRNTIAAIGKAFSRIAVYLLYTTYEDVATCSMSFNTISTTATVYAYGFSYTGAIFNRTNLLLIEGNNVSCRGDWTVSALQWVSAQISNDTVVVVARNRLHVHGNGSSVFAIYYNSVRFLKSVLYDRNILETNWTIGTTLVGNFWFAPYPYVADFSQELTWRCNRATLNGVNDTAVLDMARSLITTTVLPCDSCDIHFDCVTNASIGVRFDVPTQSCQCSCISSDYIPPRCLPRRRTTATQTIVFSTSTSLSISSTQSVSPSQTGSFTTISETRSSSKKVTPELTTQQPPPTTMLTTIAPQDTASASSAPSSFAPNTPAPNTTSPRARIDSSSASITHSRSTPLELLPPPPNAEKASAEATLAIVVSKDVAKATVATSSVSSAATSVVTGSAAAATQASLVGRLSSVVQCIYSETNAEPDFLQFVWAPSFSLFGAPDSATAAYAGGVLITTITVTAVFVLSIAVACGSARVSQRWWHKLPSILHGMSLGLYIASIAEGITLTLRWSGNTAQMISAIGCVVVLLVAGGVMVRLIVRACPDIVIATAESDETSRTLKQTLLVKTNVALPNQWLHPVAHLQLILGYIDGARDANILRVRLFFIEDLLVNVVVGVLSGWHPASGSCLGVAGAMVVVTLLHLAYLVAVNPYEKKLDRFFSLLFGTAQVIQTLLAAAIIASSSETFEIGLAYVILVQSWGFFFQLGVQLFWMVYVYNRKTSSRPAATEEKAEELIVLTTPMLTVPPPPPPLPVASFPAPAPVKTDLRDPFVIMNRNPLSSFP